MTTSACPSLGRRLPLFVTWSPSTDNAGISGYRVYRGSSAGTLRLYNTVASTTYTDTTVRTGKPYCHAVAAFDLAGPASAKSAAACTTVPK